MAQYLRPNAYGGNQVGTWYGGYAQVDEVTRDDTDFLNSTNNSAGDYTTVRLSAPASAPDVGIMFVRYVYGLSDTNSSPMAPASGGSATYIKFDIEENVGGTWTTRNSGSVLQCPTSGNWSSIELQIAFNIWGLWDLSLLRIKINFDSGGGGGPANRRGVAVSWIEVEVPDPPSASFTLPVTSSSLTATPAASVFDIATGVTSGSAAFVGDTNLNFQLTATQSTLVSPSALTFSKTPVDIPFAITSNVQEEALAFSGSQNSYDVANAITAGSLSLTGEDIALALTELYFLPVNEGQIVFNGSVLQADTSLVVDYATISLTGSNVTANNSLITSNSNLQLTPDDIFLQLGVVAGITINASPSPLAFTPNNLTAFTAIFNNRGKIDGQPQAIINTNNDSLTLYNRKGGYHSIDYGITTLQ